MLKILALLAVLILIGSGVGILLGKSNGFIGWLKGDLVENTEKQRSFYELSDREIVEVGLRRPVGSDEIAGSDDGDNQNNFYQTLKVEVVNTPQSTILGLSGREKIGQDGMLFIFSEKAFRSFWMKDMKFDLDIIWIADRKVVEISRKVPKPELNIPDFRLPVYSPEMNVDMVLEIDSGKADVIGIEVGDEIGLY
jgi:uncharacterized protein